MESLNVIFSKLNERVNDALSNNTFELKNVSDDEAYKYVYFDVVIDTKSIKFYMNRETYQITPTYLSEIVLSEKSTEYVKMRVNGVRLAMINEQINKLEDKKSKIA